MSKGGCAKDHVNGRTNAIHALSGKACKQEVAHTLVPVMPVSNWRCFGLSQTNTWTHKILYPDCLPKRAHDGPRKFHKGATMAHASPKDGHTLLYAPTYSPGWALRRAHMVSGKSHKEKKSVENLWEHTQLTESGYNV